MKDEKYGVFLLNGDKFQEDSKKFVAKGARFHYTKTSSSETLETIGPLNAFLVVMVSVAKSILVDILDIDIYSEILNDAFLFLSFLRKGEGTTAALVEAFVQLE